MIKFNIGDLIICKYDCIGYIIKLRSETINIYWLKKGCNHTQCWYLRSANEYVRDGFYKLIKSK